MLQTLREPDDFSPSLDPSRHVSIFALANTLTRLVAGFLSDYMSSRDHPISRIPLFMLLAILQVLACFILAYAPLASLRSHFFLGTALLGLGYGGIFTLAPTIVSVVWGVGGFGRNWGILTFSPGITVWCAC
jgi:MFS family permease